MRLSILPFWSQFDSRSLVYSIFSQWNQHPHAITCFLLNLYPFILFYFPRHFWPLVCQCTWPTEPQTSVNPSIQLLSLALLKKFARVLSSQVTNFMWVFIPAHQFLFVLEIMPLFISLALNSACLLFPKISFPIIFLCAKDLPVPLGKLRPLGKNSLNFFPNHLQIKLPLDLSCLLPSYLRKSGFSLHHAWNPSHFLRNLLTDEQISPLSLQSLLHSQCFSLSTCSSQILNILLAYNFTISQPGYF